MAYSPLPIEEVDLEKVLLDLDNYRIPTAQESQADALEFLFVSEDVLSLMKLILRNGYFDNEIPVVIPDSTGSRSNNYIVLEGNRRVCALLAMANPSSVPRYEKEIRSLLKRYAEEEKDLPDKIRVMVASTREDAEPHIARLHTGLPKKRWTLDQQAKFYYSRLSSTTSVDDLKQYYPGIKITRLLKMASMRQFISGAQFSDRSLRSYATSDDLKMSSFEYAFRRKEIAKSIGATFNKDGLLEPITVSPSQLGAALSGQQLRALEYLLTEFRAGRLDTRSPEFKAGTNHEGARMSLLRVLEGTTPIDPQELKETKQTDHVASAESPQRDAAEQRPPARTGNSGPQHDSSPVLRGPNRPDKNSRLIFSEVNYSSTHVNLRHRYDELKRINVFDFPIAASMLMRSVLESTIKAHFEPTNIDANGMLSEVFKQVRAVYKGERALATNINRIASGNSDTPGSIKWFNDPAHSPDTVISGAEVHEAWRLISPLLRHLLRPAPNHVAL